MISLTNNLFRLIIFCLTFQIIILLPKVWGTDSFLLSAAETAQTLQKQVGKRVEFDVDQNLISQISPPKATVPSDMNDQTEEKTKPDLKKPKKNKLTWRQPSTELWKPIGV